MRHSQLFEVAGTDGLSSPFARLRQDREKQSGEDRDYGDYDK
jgi:hypothetical protein